MVEEEFYGIICFFKRNCGSTIVNQSKRRIKLSNFLKKLLYLPILKDRAERLGKHIINSTQNCDSLLDYGCGNMILTEHLKYNTDMKVIGIDMVDNNLSNLPLLKYNGEKLPFEDNSFDATLAVFVLHHCDNTEDALKELIRVSRKKVIIIEEVYRNFFEKFILFSHDWIGNHLESWTVNIPLNFLPMKKWQKVFDENNLVLKEAKKVHQFPFFNITNQVYFELSKQ